MTWAWNASDFPAPEERTMELELRSAKGELIGLAELPAPEPLAFGELPRYVALDGRFFFLRAPHTHAKRAQYFETNAVEKGSKAYEVRRVESARKLKSVPKT